MTCKLQNVKQINSALGNFGFASALRSSSRRPERTSGSTPEDQLSLSRGHRTPDDRTALHPGAHRCICQTTACGRGPPGMTDPSRAALRFAERSHAFFFKVRHGLSGRFRNYTQLCDCFFSPPFLTTELALRRASLQQVEWKKIKHS